MYWNVSQYITYSSSNCWIVTLDVLKSVWHTIADGRWYGWIVTLDVLKCGAMLKILSQLNSWIVTLDVLK